MYYHINCIIWLRNNYSYYPLVSVSLRVCVWVCNMCVCVYMRVFSQTYTFVSIWGYAYMPVCVVSACVSAYVGMCYHVCVWKLLVCVLIILPPKVRRPTMFIVCLRVCGCVGVYACVCASFCGTNNIASQSTTATVLMCLRECLSVCLRACMRAWACVRD